ncbi:MAG: 16S rRNA (adenine(1518)-N(6)/adenine(1519)-N(6))-dimethyltransferase RsmA [Candidatus Omnitrophota bacterium]
MRPADRLPPAFVPKKRLGQNFLVDRHVIARVVDACSFSLEETVLEIGPGQGALTREILPRVKAVIAVEADRALADSLAIEVPGPHLQVHQADILKFDLSLLPRPIKVVGNIPYNISTPIIVRVMENRRMFTTLFITVQHEFGMRLVAVPGTKDYSSLSCFVQMFGVPRILFKISPAAFRPAPKVVSCFMRIDLRHDKPAEDVWNEACFIRVVRTAFQQRRKNLLNSLAAFAPKDRLALLFKAAGIDPQARAENLTIAQYARIANGLHGSLPVDEPAAGGIIL